MLCRMFLDRLASASWMHVMARPGNSEALVGLYGIGPRIMAPLLQVGWATWVPLMLTFPSFGLCSVLRQVEHKYLAVESQDF